MSCALQQVPGLARSYLGQAGRRGTLLASRQFLSRPSCRTLTANSLLMNKDSWREDKDHKERLKDEREYLPKQHTFGPEKIREEKLRNERVFSQTKRHTFEQCKDEELLKYERDYCSSKKYTSTAMTDEDVITDEDIDGRLQEDQEQTFGSLSNKFKHKFKPLGTDLIEELEEAKLGDDWVKPKVKKNTPIWYGNQMKQLIKAGKLDEAIEMLEVTMLKEAKVFPTEYNYNVLIGGCGRAGFTHKAFKLYNRMKQRGLEPSSVTYTALFNACAESPWKPTDGLARVRKLHQQLVEKSVKVNLITHHAMMKAYAKCGDLGMTFRLYRHLVDSGVHLMSKTFAFLLFACAEDKETGYLYGLEVWRQMLAQGVKPDLYTYNLLLRTTRDCGIGDLDTANRVLLRDVQPKTRQTPLLTESNRGRGRKQRRTLGKDARVVMLLGKKAELVAVDTFQPEEYLGLEDDSESQEVEVPTIPFNSKHHHLVRERKTSQARGIKSSKRDASNTSMPSVESATAAATYWWDSVDDISQSLDVTDTIPEASPINHLVPSAEGHHLPGRPSRGEGHVDVPNLLDLSVDLSNVESLARVSGPSDRLALLGGVQGLLGNMAENGLRPDVKTLSLLAEVLPGRRQEENELMEYVREQDVKVDVDFYNVFIRRRNRRGHLKAAKSVLCDIGERKLFPNLRTYVNLALGCGNPEEGFQILNEMEEAGIKPTCHVYGALIGASQKRRNYGYLVDLLKHMEARDVTPNERVITHLEKIAAFGQNKIAQSQRTTRPVNKSEWNQFRGFYIQWLSRMKVQTPEHPWQKYFSKEDKAEIKFHETAI